MIYRIMSLPGKDICEGIGYPTRPSQSKGTSSRLGGSELGKSKTLSCLEGEVIEMLRTWHRRCRTRTRRLRSTKNCIYATTSLDLSLSKIRVGSIKYFIDTTTSSTIGLIGCETTRSIGASPQKIGVLSVEDCIDVTVG
jgi:hypothetical protein